MSPKRRQETSTRLHGVTSQNIINTFHRQNVATDLTDFASSKTLQHDIDIFFTCYLHCFCVLSRNRMFDSNYMVSWHISGTI
jgi:hypothetical protein